MHMFSEVAKNLRTYYVVFKMFELLNMLPFINNQSPIQFTESVKDKVTCNQILQ